MRIHLRRIWFILKGGATYRYLISLTHLTKAPILIEATRIEFHLVVLTEERKTV